MGVALLQNRNQLKSAHARHEQVRHDQIDRLPAVLETMKSLQAVGGIKHPASGIFQNAAGDSSEGRFVVHQEYSRGWVGRVKHRITHLAGRELARIVPGLGNAKLHQETGT